MLLKDYKTCSTGGLKKLDTQLINQVNIISPGLLVYFGGVGRITCGAGCHPYLQQPAVDALIKAIAARPGIQLRCNSAYRTVAQQFVLYNQFLHKDCGITAAAIPGNSNHNSGLSLDIEDYAGWKPYLEAYDYDWLGSWDKWHFDYVGNAKTKPQLKDIRKISILAFQQLWNANRKLATPEYFKLDENGVWCERTKEALLYTPIEGFRQTIAVTNKTNVPANKLINKSSLRRGDKNQDVKELQMLLNKLSFKLTVDGDFGLATEKAVKIIQSNNGLTADGVVGQQTWNKLLG